MKLRPPNPKNDNQVQLSASAMEAYFQCPRKLLMASRWQGTQMATAQRDGLDAHSLMAGDLCPHASPTACAYAETLTDLALANGITVNHHEVLQTFEIGDDVIFKRIIDGIGEYQGVPVLIDWKTAKKGEWPSFHHNRKKYVPKARGFQAVAYLIPPPPEELERLGLDAWPEQILFVIGDAYGGGEIVALKRDADLEVNFYRACWKVAEAIRNDDFPAYYGGSCGLLGTSWACDFIPICYNLPDWEAMYSPIREEVEER